MAMAMAMTDTLEGEAREGGYPLLETELLHRVWKPCLKSRHTGWVHLSKVLANPKDALRLASPHRL